MQYILSLGYPKKEHLNMDEWGKYKAGALQIIDWESGQLLLYPCTIQAAPYCYIFYSGLLQLLV